MEEDNIKTWESDWSGTGAISGSGDSELVTLDDGEYLESQVVETGLKVVELRQNKYVAGDSAIIYYKQGATRAGCLADTWHEYLGPFVSTGFAQMRIEAPTILLPQYMISSYGNQLDDFEDHTDWQPQTGTNTPTDNTTQFKEGSASMKLELAGSTTGKLDRSVNWDLSSSQVLQIWVYWHDSGAGAAETITIYLNSVDSHSSFTKYWQTTIETQVKISNGWNCIRLGRDDFIATGGMTWGDAVRLIRLQFSNVSGRNHAYSVDDMRSHVTGYSAAVISFDDNYASHYSRAYPTLSGHNMLATIFPIGNALRDADYLALNNAGWTIGNHSYTHPSFTALTQAQIETELTNCATALTSGGYGDHGLHYCAYPSGLYDADSDAALTALGFRFGRSVSGVYNLPLEAPNPYRIGTFTLQASTTISSVNSALSIAARRLQACILYGHEVVASGATGTQINQSFLEEICQSIIARGMYAISYHDLYQLTQGSHYVRIPRD